MLTSKQRAYLRSMSNKVNPITQVGKGGISDNLIVQIDEALEARELIKITVLENSPIEIREVAELITNSVHGEIVQIIGKKLTIYRQSREPSIILP